MTLHLAWCSPLPLQRSGIADYSVEILPTLSAKCQVTCFAPNSDVVAPGLLRRFQVRPLSDLPKVPDALPVYHIGNHVEFHGEILRAALARPGVVVLHELVLYDLVERVLLDAGQAAGFAAYVRTIEPRADAKRIRAAVQGRVDPHYLPLCEPLVWGARGSVVFNTWAAEELHRRCPGIEVATIPQHALPAPQRSADRVDLRSRYRLPQDAFVLGSFGHQTPAKRLDVALAAFALLHANHPESVYIFAGPPSPRVDVAGLATSLGVGPAVRQYGYVTERMWWDLLACTDLCVSLRGPTQGETSASLLKQLAAGNAVCISTPGPDAAYPGGVVCRIPQGRDETQQLRLAMGKALTDPAWRRGLGERAQAYVEEHHSVERSAEALLAACAAAAAAPAPARHFDFEAALHQTGRAAALLHRWVYRARVVRRVARQHGWKAVLRGVQRRTTSGATRQVHADSD